MWIYVNWNDQFLAGWLAKFHMATPVCLFVRLYLHTENFNIKFSGNCICIINILHEVGLAELHWPRNSSSSDLGLISRSQRCQKSRSKKLVDFRPTQGEDTISDFGLVIFEVDNWFISDLNKNFNGVFFFLFFFPQTLLKRDLAWSLPAPACTCSC